MLHTHLIRYLLIGVMPLLSLTGCGAEGVGGGENSFLSLTIGDNTFHSSTQETISLEDNTQFITTVRVSEGGEITLGGEDSDLFQIEGINLSFKHAVDAWNPSDSDRDGDYKLVISASEGEEIITYTVTYQISTPIGAKTLLSGKSFYVELSGKNHFYYRSFGETSFDQDEYIDYEKDNSKYNISVDYHEDTFTYTLNSKTTTCTLKSESPLTFDCTDDSGTETVVFLTDKPAFDVPDSWKVSATAEEIYNDDNITVPQVTGFTVTGNAPAVNGKAQIYTNKMDGNFTLKGTISNTAFAQSVMVKLDESTQGVIRTFGAYSADDEQTFDCIFKSDDPTLHYECEGVSIQEENATRPRDTYIGFLACNDEDTSDPDTRCNSAWVPVLFVDE